MTQNNEKQQQFLALFEPVRHRLSHYVQAMVYNRDEARDIISETIAIAYERCSSVHTPQSFVFFLFTIARRLHAKRRWRHRLFLPLAAEHDGPRLGDHAPDTLADVRLLYEALDKLPLKQRETVVLFYLSGLSLEQVRALQGGTLSGVKSRLRRGKQQLAELLGAEDDVDDPPNAVQQEHGVREHRASAEQHKNWYTAYSALFTTGRFV